MNTRKLAKQFGRLIEKVIEEEKKNPMPKYEETYATLIFTEEECGQMGARIGFGLLYKWDRAVRVIKRKIGEKRRLYILRLRRGGYNVEVQDGDLRECKRKFIQKTFDYPISDETIEALNKAKEEQKDLSLRTA